MAESSSKRQKTEENAEESESDRLSNLPDSVLCHILSFLPTKTCVTTSVLSRRWRHLWEHLQVLDLYDDSHIFYHHIELFKRFAVFVNAVFTLRRAHSIRKFRLSCGHSQNDTFYAHSVATWVRAAIGPYLEDLCLTLYSTDGHGFVVPPSLFTCTNLVSLSLCGGIHLQNRNPNSVIRLPSLKTLQLDIDSVDCIDTLLSGCPVLETLHLSFAPQCLTKICVPRSLKRLKYAVENNVEIFLELHAPALEFLSIVQRTRSFPCSIGNLDNVVEAYLDVYVTDESAEPLFKLLKALSGLKYLVMRNSTMKWLLRGPNLDLPDFRYLLHLELVLPCFNSGFLMNLLNKCHMLQVLIIQNEKDSLFSRNWPQPTSGPNCVGTHLTFVQVKGFQGFADELAFVTYVLRRGRVLRTMIVYADMMLDLSHKYRILKFLSGVPRASTKCQLNFD
ncbi:F-box protein At4g09920-like [Abrus precatorius]|uniref:F-box protein At4g09920-like n=1 Tax=Abrus precatorius TaxID=3816 RepID=A0A8B8K008_ABRPR|nr:F-box protein At4g09920-like [Abrus precatorius]